MDRAEPTLAVSVKGFRKSKGTIAVPNHGSPSTALSPGEFASLRRVAKGLGHTISDENKKALLAMGLAFDGIEGLEATELGRRRVERGDMRGEEWSTDLVEPSPGNV